MKTLLMSLLFTASVLTFASNNAFCQDSNPPKLKALDKSLINLPGGYVWSGYSHANYWHIGWMLAGKTVGIESNFIGIGSSAGHPDYAVSVGLDYRLIPDKCFFGYAALNYITENDGYVFPTVGVNFHIRETPGLDVIFKIGKAISKEYNGTDIGMQIAFGF